MTDVHESRTIDANAPVLLGVATTLAFAFALLVPPLASGIAAKSMTFAVASGIAAIFAWRVAFQSPADRFAPLSLVGLGIFVVASFLSLQNAKSVDAARVALFSVGGMLALHFAATTLLRFDRSARVFSFCAVLAGAVIATFGLLGFRDFAAALASGSTSGAGRSAFLATPFFEHGYLAAQAVAPLAPLALAAALVRQGVAARIALGLCLVLIGGFILATLSRATAAATALGLAVTIVAIVRARRDTTHPAASSSSWRVRVILASLVILVCGGFFLAIDLEAFLERFRSLFDPTLVGSNFMRVALWIDSFELAMDAAPFGVGLGNYGFFIGDYHFAARPLAHAHDQALHTLAEIGVLGGFGLLLTVLATLRAATLWTASADASGLRAGFLGAFVTMLALSIPESPLAFPGGAAMFAVASAGVLARSRLARNESNRELSRHWPLVVAGLAFIVGAEPVIRYARAGLLASTAQAAMVRADVATARDALIEAARLAPTLPEIHALRAVLEDRAGQPHAALEAWSAHDAMVPGLPEAMIQQATLEMTVDRPNRAADLLVRARRRAPPESNIGLRIELANALHRAQRFDAARLVLVEVVSQQAHMARPAVLLRLAECLVNLGRERATAMAALLQYESLVGPTERAYSTQLRESLDDWYEN